MAMVMLSFGESFSAGLGLAMGVTMAQYVYQSMKPPERRIRQVIICLKCGGKNPGENRFCGQCGQPLYPPPPIQCPTCHTPMSSTMRFCGRCGSLLRKAEATRKKRR